MRLIALYFLIIAAEPAVIRASLAALFFFTDLYAMILSYFNDILDFKNKGKEIKPDVIITEGPSNIANNFISFLYSKIFNKKIIQFYYQQLTPLSWNQFSFQHNN